jgi:geranylgeranyl diphosphate synthase type I
MTRVTQPAPDTWDATQEWDDLFVGRLRQQVEEVLNDFLTAKSATAPDACLPPVVDVVREAVAGGKRLRPVFCHCGWMAGGGTADDSAVTRVIGAALELFHSFTLIHDDIMDGSDLRRGRPAVHRRFAALHANQPVALADRLGVNSAILVGDLCLVWSDELLHTADIEPERSHETQALLNTMRTEVMAGQYLDLLPRTEDVWLSCAWRTIDLKTAGYTVVRPLQLGATLAGAGPAVLGACQEYGLPLGEAFQLRDDLLGTFGDPEVTGKPSLDDLREGKPTVLMALTWRRASPTDRRTLHELHGDPTLDESGAEALRDLVRRTGADVAVEHLISDRCQRAVAALTTAPIPRAARRALTELVALVTSRDH